MSVDDDQESHRRGPWTWVAMVGAIVVILGGQLLYSSGRVLPGSLVVGLGGLALMAIIARAALAGLPKKRKRRPSP